MADDLLKRDLRIAERADGVWDLVPGNIAIDGVDNVVQALRLRFLVEPGELAALGHPEYGGAHIRDLLGEPMTPANLNLLQWTARAIVLAEERVADIERMDIHLRADIPGAVELIAAIRTIEDETAEFSITLSES